MGQSQTVSWRETRARRKPNEEAVARNRAAMEIEQRAYVLRELREDQGLTQQDLADRLHVTQPTVSALESGDLDRSALSTLRAYIAALGGSLEVTADFGGHRYVLSADR